MTAITADGLFERYFWPHYPPDVRADPTRFRDLDANPGRNPALVAHLVEAAELFARNAPALLGLEALPLSGDGVARLARALSRERRDALLAASDPADPGNPLFNTVVHAAAFVGEAAVRAHGAAWAMRRPMWESLVVLPRSAGGGHGGGAVPPFHWLLKHLSDAEIDSGSLAYRFHIHVELATADVDAFPVIAPPRKLPPLKRPTYDLLVKYLQQHLPTLRDVGAGFPSPAEFTDRAYAALSFELLHGGRVLALHGQAPSRGEQPSLVEVTWLTSRGFDHADALPADEHPPYFGRARGDDTLEIALAWQGRPRTHTLTFRGHR